MMSWYRWSANDGIWFYAHRRVELTPDERAYGLVGLVEARNFEQLMDRTDAQDALERDYRERRGAA